MAKRIYRKYKEFQGFTFADYPALHEKRSLRIEEPASPEFKGQIEMQLLDEILNELTGDSADTQALEFQQEIVDEIDRRKREISNSEKNE